MADYYKTKESVQEYIHLAKDVDGQDLIKRYTKHLPEKAKLLELGSGPGTDWRILARDYQITGSDNSPEFLKHLTTNYPDGHFLELDAVTIETKETYDGIYSNKVLHHLSDDELHSSIQSQVRTLNTNGIICHSFWYGEGSEIYNGLYVNYHTENSLTGVFGQYFDILELVRYTEFDKDDSLLLIGRKLSDKG